MFFIHQVLANLMSSTTNEIFAHYIFMDNRFMLPTASGLPLTFTLSGTFTPGAKGGIRMSPQMVCWPSFVCNLWLIKVKTVKVNLCYYH